MSLILIKWALLIRNPAGRNVGFSTSWEIHIDVDGVYVALDTMTLGKKWEAILVIKRLVYHERY